MRSVMCELSANKAQWGELGKKKKKKNHTNLNN